MKGGKAYKGKMDDQSLGSKNEFITIFLIVIKVFTSITRDYHKVMEVFFSVKTFDVHLIYMFWDSLSLKNWFLEIDLYVYVWLCGEYLALYIHKTNEDRNTKFHTQYLKSV